MIKKLQGKFISITMISLSLIIVLLLGSINGINLYQMEHRINGAIQILSENQGRFPKFERREPRPNLPEMGFQMNPETAFETRYFIVKVSADGAIIETDTAHIAAVTPVEATSYANKIMDTGREKGYDGVYKYAVIEEDYGSMIIFIDCRIQLQNARTILFASMAVALITLLLMFILITIFSKRAIKPIIESTEKQKQFITDAGHEIKTPIAIISANADVLELEGGTNEWLNSIRNQTARLDKLVKNLLTLAKVEESNIHLSFTEFDISELVYEAGKSFEAMAKMQGKQFEMNINQNMQFHGDESSIQQLITILADNAIKYSDNGGLIKLELSSAKKGIKLQVYNTLEVIDKENLSKLFDRFYRLDTSRSRESGGYGIGLSIAKSIVEAHHGKITVRSDDGRSICFTIIFL